MRIDTLHDIGNIIRTVRRQRKLTQAQLADVVGVSREWISNVERGAKDNLGIALILRALHALDITLDAKLPPVVIDVGTANISVPAHALEQLLPPGSTGGELP